MRRTEMQIKKELKQQAGNDKVTANEGNATMAFD